MSAQLALFGRRVAALYVDRNGPYFTMPDVDAWDQADDARRYCGPLPIVAHPPCGPWGELRHMYKGSEHDIAPLAVDQLRSCGGVLEHPRRSLLWAFVGAPPPSHEGVDEYGGFTVDVNQCDWGHVARKPTRLYFVGVQRAALQFPPRGVPTHWICGSRKPRPDGRGGVIPPGIKVCSAEQRRRTPPAFAAWLVELAARAKPCRARAEAA